jgi:hypothetical protein
MIGPKPELPLYRILFRTQHSAKRLLAYWLAAKVVDTRQCGRAHA